MYNPINLADFLLVRSKIDPDYPGALVDPEQCLFDGVKFPYQIWMQIDHNMQATEEPNG